MQIPHFANSWRRVFGDTPPLSHVLRRRNPELWVRFHALPKSTRYADTADETAIILQRANALTMDCFGAGQIIWISTVNWTSDIHPPSDLVARMGMAKTMTWVDEDEDPEDQLDGNFFATQHVMLPGSLDRLFSDISEERDRAVLFSEVSETVIAPYDGGFDIFCPRPARLEELRWRYRRWLPDREDGL